MKTIYVAGPLSGPTPDDVMKNVEFGMYYGAALIAKGWAPFVPHLFEFLDKYQADGYQDGRIPYEKWMVMDFEWIRRCDALFLIAPSPGANRELSLAETLGKPIYRCMDEVPDITSNLPLTNRIGGDYNRRERH